MGGKSLTLLKVMGEEAVPPVEIIAFCGLLNGRFAATVKSNTLLTPF
jgi:hypothetical protein